MITLTDIELLQGLTKKKPHAVKLGGKVLLYSQWFALELPTAQLDPAFDDWDETPHDAAVRWREWITPGDGEYAMGTRWTNPDDGVVLIRLFADSASAIIHPSIFEVVNKKMPAPEFRVFPGDNKPVVGIFSEGVLVGGVAQMKVDP
jgi:hypothetical protein